MTETIEAKIEDGYERDSKMAWLLMLGTVLRNLDRNTTEWNVARLPAEREMAVSVLRRVCTEHGDNDWSDNLHLADVIEKHLARHLS